MAANLSAPTTSWMNRKRQKAALAQFTETTPGVFELTEHGPADLVWDEISPGVYELTDTPAGFVRGHIAMVGDAGYFLEGS